MSENLQEKVSSVQTLKKWKMGDSNETKPQSLILPKISATTAKKIVGDAKKTHKNFSSNTGHSVKWVVQLFQEAQ